MSHLTYPQRYTIQQMLTQGHTQKHIADTLQKDKSVINREIRRNCDKRSSEYRADLAQRKYDNRQEQKRKHKKFTKEIQAYVEEKLADKLSPEQIVGRAKVDSESCVSTERIYQHIWQDKKQGGDLYKHLRTQGKKYRKRGNSKDKRGQIKNRVSIQERAQIVEKRERFGDLEIDTIIGKNHKGAIVTINDRSTGWLKMKKLNGKNAQELANQVIGLMRPYKKQLHTITSDNGKEFALHQQIAEQLGIGFYFADPYKSCQRGSNENLNGLIRQYIPKKSNFDEIDDEYVQWVEDELNNRPRKRYGFLSPNEVKIKKVALMT